MSARLLAMPALVLGLFAFAAPARATGGVWCDADDGHLRFHFKAVSSRDGTGGWFGIEGLLELKNAGRSLPAELRTFSIAEAALIERWWDGDDIRLLVQKTLAGADGQARVQLTVKTSAVEEADYRGTYRLEIDDPATAGQISPTDRDMTGAIACSAD